MNPTLGAGRSPADAVMDLAALLDREFCLDWLEELTGMRASAILAVLEEEVQRQVLTRKGPATYVFRDDRKRAELLGKIPRADERRHRRGIVAVLTRDLPDDDSKALELAGHLLHLQNDWRDCQWLVRAGEIHVQAFRREKALLCFEKVITELAEKRGENEDRLYVKAVLGHSSNIAVRVDASRSLGWLREGKKRAKILKGESYELLLEMHMAKYEWLRSDFEAGLKRFRRALARVQALNDPDLVRQTSKFTTTFLFWQGRFKDVVSTHESTLPDVEKHPIGHFPLVTSMMVGYCYTAASRLTQGLGMLDAIREHCLNNGDRYLAAYASTIISMAMLSINRPEEALRHLEAASEETGSSRNSAADLVVSALLALASYRLQDKSASAEHLRKFVANRRESQAINSTLPPYLIELCWAVERGQLPAIPGLSFGDEIGRMVTSKSLFVKGIGLRYQAMFCAAKGSPTEKVRRSFLLSEKWLKASGSEPELAKTRLELARHCFSTGDERNGKRAMKSASCALGSSRTELIPDDLKPFLQDTSPDQTILAELMALRPEMILGSENRKLLPQIVATANRLTGGERGALLLVDHTATTPALRLKASKNLTVEQLEHPSFEASRQIMEGVLRSAEGRIFEVSCAGHGEPKETIRSGVCVPVWMGQGAVGVLYCDNRLLPDMFKEDHLHLLEYCAALASLELENLNTRAELQQLRSKQRELEESVDWEAGPLRRVDGVLGVSAAINRVLAAVERVAKTDTAVLILGETGVGKNVLAEAIHRQSLRADGRFVTVQCSALAEGLITSELFGHEKGAFTGASDRRIGRFELAHGGTLFLDEVGDLSLDIQARLLRVLQSKEFERVGGGREILTSDFRLIAATNRDLEEDVRAKRFREDLFYRINVFPISIPPLRQRKEDLPLLAQHFLTLHSARQGKEFRNLRQGVLDEMTAYDWPGNIRELENVIQRGVISSRPPEFQLPRLGKAQPDAPSEHRFDSLKDKEREHILGALRACGGKIHGPGGAAELLEINASTLTSRIKKLGIARPQRSSPAA
ncbi:MAG: sigma 54-interacting transcriptional regulator [Deltaproteobacteria bacterium]|nr:sigma 54-interacting transcriptional regulator [Deltaproteobacteria bacterium]